MRGADLLVRTLKRAGTERILSLSGNQIMPVYDACLEAGVEIVHVRHEAAALYMAEAHAQLSGTVGVALVTAGTGAANAMGPLVTARESDTPILLLTGDSPVAQDGRGAFQEMGQVAMASQLAKLSLRPRSAAEMGEAVARALRTARSGRPGPVHVSLPADVVEQEAETGEPAAAALDRETMPAGAGELDALCAALGGAERPVILAGPALNATRFSDLPRLAETVDAPVIPLESPRGLNDPALGAVAEVLAEADVVLCLGKRMDFTLGFGAEARFPEVRQWVAVHADAESRDLCRRNLGGRLTRATAADPRDVAGQLIAAAPGRGLRGAWRESVAGWLARRQEASAGAGISPAALCAAVQRRIEAAAAAILVSDGGEFGQWAQAGLTAPRRIVNGVSGAIGGGLCYGISAALQDPGATIFALMGDGTAGFHIAEFETAARHGAALVAVIGNDRRWNAEHQIQIRKYGAERAFACELSGARYDLVAEALGGHGEFVTAADGLDAALARAVDSGRPACVNVAIEGAPAPSIPLSDSGRIPVGVPSES